MNDSSLPIAIVGAGFCGTMAAIHLLSRLGRRSILLCERNERFARGTAYGTEDPGHLLNVRASNMSALPDRPNDFTDWLDRAGLGDAPGVVRTAAGVFVSRHLYGSYLTSLLGTALSEGGGAARLLLTPDEAVDLVPEGDAYRLRLAGGRDVRVAGLVLAAGVLLPPSGAGGACIDNPWAGGLAEGLDPTRPVVVIGSGLTMIDIVLHLDREGFEGPVIAISRHGLPPHSHATSGLWPGPRFTAAQRRSPSLLIRAMRAEAKAAMASGVDWRAAVDSVRPLTADLWQGLDADGQRRFLRHARAFWDVHRHRMAVPVGDQIALLRRRGRLDIRAGRVVEVTDDGLGAEVRYRPRGRAAVETIAAQRVIRATGTLDPQRSDNPLVRRLIERGLARSDRHGLGLDLTPALDLIGADGHPSTNLWALGPLAQGTFWECTAVPDIRHQAVAVADRAAAALNGRERPPSP